MKKQTNQTIQNLKGFRDFLPEEKRKRDYVQSKVVETFQQFGFEPIGTPTLEYASLLLGKYGDEADKLVYSFEDRGGRQVALRYDQTVPTARITSQYQNDLPPYFRRYQIQSVFRADKPQKGRYREFTQCDVDIFNSTSSLADAEIVACTYASFANVGFKNIEIRINDRQVLFAALSSFATKDVPVLSIIQSVDKLDKMPQKAIVAELVEKGLSQENATRALIKINEAKLSENLENIIQSCQDLGVPKESLIFTSTLARGLDYYTGMIFEVILPEYPVGSCGGGGRYDNLIADLGGNDTPAVGIAFGFDRMVEAASSLDLIPTDSAKTQVLVTVFDEKTASASLEVAKTLRLEGIRTELYPAFDKLGKQFKLANRKDIPWVVIIGEEEVAQGKVQLKNMESGEQVLLEVGEVMTKLQR